MILVKRGPFWVQYNEKGEEIGRSRFRPLQEVKPDMADFIKALDVNDDSLWTKSGKVKMSVVEAVYGVDVSRSDVIAAVGDYDRHTGVQHADS